MKAHIYTIHEVHKDYKCESCGRSFSQAGVLKRHIHTVHEGHKDYKCESCGKLFTTVRYLKLHIKKFIKAALTTSVQLVENLLLRKDLWRNTSL